MSALPDARIDPGEIRTLRLDADVIDWFKAPAADGEGYQARINRVRLGDTGC